MDSVTLFYLGAASVALIIIITLIRTGRFLRSLLFSALTGNAALFAISWLGAFTGITLVPGIFTVGTATLLGLPGVLGMLILKILFT